MFPTIPDEDLQELEQGVESRRQIIKFEESPITIKTKEDLIEAISIYFQYINNNNEIPTFTGLAKTLGITRHKLLNLPPNNNFTPIIEKAKQCIVEYAEKQLFQPKASAGVQFWLKNNDGWVDKQDLSITTQKTMVDILREIEDQPRVINGELAPQDGQSPLSIPNTSPGESSGLSGYSQNNQNNNDFLQYGE